MSTDPQPLIRVEPPPTRCSKCGQVHGENVRHVRRYGPSVLRLIAECSTEDEVRTLAAMTEKFDASYGTRMKWERAARKRLAVLKARLWTPDSRIVDASGKVVAQ